MYQYQTFIDDTYSNAVGSLEMQQNLSKLQEAQPQTRLVGIELLNIQEPKSPVNILPTKPAPTKPSTGIGSTMMGQFMPIGAGGGLGKGIESPEIEEGQMQTQATTSKKTNLILLGLGGLALVYFLFLRKK